MQDISRQNFSVLKKRLSYQMHKKLIFFFTNHIHITKNRHKRYSHNEIHIRVVQQSEQTTSMVSNEMNIGTWT